MTAQAAPIPELSAVREAIGRARASFGADWRRLLKMERWEVYTDGSAPIKNPGGAIGFSSVFLLDNGGALEIYGGVPGRTSEPATSNNRAEIAGAVTILEVLHLVAQEGGTLPSGVEIVCDSQYVVKCATGQYKKHKNKDLWRRFDQLMCVARQKKVKVSFRWTRAHVGTEWNERADVLAKDGAYLAIGKKPQGAAAVAAVGPKNGDGAERPDCHYVLQLYSEMSGKGAAKAAYRLATSTRERRATLEFDDVMTLDEAEYQVLEAGLSDLLHTLESAGKEAGEFRILVDSCRDHMLKQLQGLYKVNSERLQPLHRRASLAVKRFAGVEWLKSGKAELKEDLKSW